MEKYAQDGPEMVEKTMEIVGEMVDAINAAPIDQAEKDMRVCTYLLVIYTSIESLISIFPDKTINSAMNTVDFALAVETASVVKSISQITSGA